MTYKFKEGSRVKILGTIKGKTKNLLYEGLKTSEEAGTLPKVLLPGGKVVVKEFEEENLPGARGIGLHLANLPGMVVGVKTHMYTPSQLESLNAKRAKRKKLDKEDEAEWKKENPGKKLPNAPLTEEDIRLKEPKYAVLFENGKSMYVTQSNLETLGEDSGTRSAQKAYDELITREKLSSTATKPCLFEIFKITKDTTTRGDLGLKRGDLNMILTMRIKSPKGIEDVIDYLIETLSSHSKVRGVIDNIEDMGSGKKRMFFVTKEGDVQSFVIVPKASPTEMFKADQAGKLHPIKGPRTIVLK